MGPKNGVTILLGKKQYQRIQVQMVFKGQYSNRNGMFRCKNLAVNYKHLSYKL